MNNNGYYSIELTNDQLWLLMNQYAPISILGMKNPWEGILSEEISIKVDSAIQELSDRNLIRVISHNELDVDDLLLQMVEACAHPDILILFTKIKVDWSKPEVIYFQIKNGQIFSREEKTLSSQNLSLIQNKENLLKIFQSELPNNIDKPNNDCEFQITEDIFGKAADAYRNIKSLKSKSLLLDSGLNIEQLSLIEKTLMDIRANFNIAIIHQFGIKENRYISGFSILAGGNHVWLIQPSTEHGKNMLSFSLAHESSIYKALCEILKEFK